MTRKTYVAVYERDPESDSWLVHIDGIPGCHTYGRTLRQAEARIREALGLRLDRDAATLTLTARWSDAVARIASEASQARSSADRAVRNAGAATTKAARDLERLGLGRRDTAEVLGISHQRVQQIVAS